MSVPAIPASPEDSLRPEPGTIGAAVQTPEPIASLTELHKLAAEAEHHVARYRNAIIAAIWHGDGKTVKDQASLDEALLKLNESLEHFRRAVNSAIRFGKEP